MDRSLELTQPEIAQDTLGFFRWGRVAGKVLVTNDAADWTLLTEPEFADLLAGRITEAHPRFEEMQRKGFVRDGLDLDALAARLAQRTRHVRRGPHLHVVTLTRRGRDEGSGEAAATMSQDTAETVIDLALQSTSPSITFELQADGGEPLGNLEVLRHFVEHARRRNERSDGKILTFRLFTNFTAMTEEAAEWLIANEVQIVTRLDGPAALHDWARQWKGGSSHADTVRWIDHFHRRYGELGRDAQLWRVNALLTTTRRTLEAGREVVDEYVARGLRTINLRPLEPAHFDSATWAEVGYGLAEYLDFYRRTLDYVVELNRRGVEIAERTATVILLKILTADDPGFVDLQSPAGAGTSEIAYDADGRVFPSDEARLLDDPIFELGRVGKITAADISRHPTVRSIAAASLLDAQPECADCWNKPFCGFSPVRNFVTQGDLFGQRHRCLECREHRAVSARLFELLADGGDPATAETLKRWTVRRSPLSIDGRLSQEAP